MAVTWDAQLEGVEWRFAWARRQGRPAWLWPEVTIETWRTTMQDVSAAASAILAGQRTAVLEGDDLAIGLAGYTSGIGPLLGLWLEQGRLRTSAAVAASLQRHLSHNRSRMASLVAITSALTDSLASRGIPALVLKGLHTGLAYFPEPGARPASDIDLLVAADDMARAEAALSAAGLALKSRNRWESCWISQSAAQQPKTLTYVHAEDPWSVDLHSGLNVSAGGGAPVAALDLADPMGSEALWRADGVARALSQPLLLLHLASHAGAGWQNLTLLRQVELVLVIRQDTAAGRLSWDAVLELGAETGALTYAYPALCMAEALAPGLVPGAVLDYCVASTPKAVRQALDPLTPATAQRIDRDSFGEHFMWATGWRSLLRQVAWDLYPRTRLSWSEMRRVYGARVWRLIKGRLSQ